ncbi:MAG: hypothetical protein U0414_00785 [Polyangiaceae bacterium]
MELSSLRLVAALAVTGVALVGCSAEPTESESEAASAVVQGVIRVDRTVSEEGVASTISAKFLRAQADDITSAERLVGTQLEIPNEGDCTLPADTRAASSLVRRPVDLVDVGDLSLRSNHERHLEQQGAAQGWQLTPRAFPDIGALVSGVFYTQPDGAFDPNLELELPAPGRYTVTATGAASVDPFTFDVDAPAVPTNVRVAGQSFAKDRDPSVVVGRDIPIEWDPEPARGAGDGLVYVDVHASKAYRCTFRDSGSAILPSDVLSSEDDAQFVVISIHRVREESVRVDLQPGAAQELTSVRFDYARSGRVAAVSRDSGLSTSEP